MELYTRFPINKICIGGYLNIKQGDICILKNDIIYFNNIPVCLKESETARAFFCYNNKDDIERADLLDILLPLTPDLEKFPKAADYGEFSIFGWQWYELILSLSNSELQNIIQKILKEDNDD